MTQDCDTVVGSLDAALKYRETSVKYCHSAVEYRDTTVKYCHPKHKPSGIMCLKSAFYAKMA